MSAALNTEPAASTLPADAETEFQRKTLHDLTVWCADVAYRLRDAVEAADTTDDILRLAAAFDTAARGVRRSVMLARHIARPPRQEAPYPAAPARPRPKLRLADHPAADRESPERLDQPDPAPDTRPIPEQIAEIRADLEPALAAHPGDPTPEQRSEILAAAQTIFASPSTRPYHPDGRALL